ncbi:hypothetical protein OIU85_006013 [Salix viminalis]|uniref:Large ribosomal subunit protein uL15/eL18 domain-containing protein n=1 Tax=Salix viminalis TaxID=40686 RepID=A0A9Q0SU10_SALVM|nr:hypothetical protein OIU85_006013 [Salix viminalis]
MATAMATASLLSLNCPSSPFKGNLTRLKPKTCNFTCLTLRSKNKRPSVVVNQAAASSVVTTSSGARLRLDNLGPQPGSRKKGKRKGREGLKGGQMPLYRRIPKLRGIAGGMHAGLPSYVPVNLKDIASAGFQEGEEVSLETLKEKGLINPSGRERRLPLKVIPVSNQFGMIDKVNRCPGQALYCWAYYSNEYLSFPYILFSEVTAWLEKTYACYFIRFLGDGELSVKLNIKARAFSAAAKEKLEAAGCSLTVLPGRKKWVKPSVAKNIARAEEYFAKKRAAATESEPPLA